MQRPAIPASFDLGLRRRCGGPRPIGIDRQIGVEGWVHGRDARQHHVRERDGRQLAALDEIRDIDERSVMQRGVHRFVGSSGQAAAAAWRAGGRCRDTPAAAS